MRTFILTITMAIIAFPAFASKDNKMTCSELMAEIEELAAIETAAGNADVADTVTRSGAAVATQGAIIAGAGSSLPLIGGLANIAAAVSNGNKEVQQKRAEDASKRIIRLETMAEMKGCETN